MNDTLTRERNVDDMVMHAIQHASNALDAAGRRPRLFGRPVSLAETPLADWEIAILADEPEAPTTPVATPGMVLTNRKARLEREAAEAAAPLRLAYSTTTGRCRHDFVTAECDYCGS